MGIANAGSAVGAVIWPIMLDQFLNRRKMSFDWTIRIVGYMVLILCLIITAGIRIPRRGVADKEGNPALGQEEEGEEETEGRKNDLSILKQRAFLLLGAGFFAASFGLFLPVFFLPLYGASHGLSTSLRFYLMSILNGASFVARISTGIMADRCGNFNMFFIMTVSAGVTCLCWTLATSPAGIIGFAIVYGYFSGVSALPVGRHLKDFLTSLPAQAMLSLQGPCSTQLATPTTRGTAIGLSMVALAIP
jgi:nitrate/nitrite transporter NarK